MLSSSTRFVSFIAPFILALPLSALAAGDVRLTTVAAENGFTYQWIPTESGAILARPGVRIVIRAGRSFYEVNNSTPTADSAPRFDGRDLVISARLAEHLRLIARKYPYASAGGMGGLPFDAGRARAAAMSEPGTLTLLAQKIQGREALALRGTGPANQSVTITLTGELSTDLPVVVLSRTTIVTAKDGTFFAEVPYGQDSHARTALIATATMPAGALPAEARVVIGIPSPRITSSGLDDWPNK